MALLVGLVGALPAEAQMGNEEQVINQPSNASGAGILINEVEMNPRGRDLGREWVELYNPTQSNIDIGNFAIQTRVFEFTITIPAGTVMGAGQFYVIKTEGETFVDYTEILTLVDSAGRTLDMTPRLLDNRNDDNTWQRIPDGSNTWKFVKTTQSEPNDPATYQNNSESGSRPASSTADTTAAEDPQCLGSALCIEGRAYRMVDTDTLYVDAEGEKYRVDLSLTKVSRSDKNYENGSKITRYHCLGSNVLVDQDDGQSRVRKINGISQIFGTVYCPSHNLNQKLLDSEFVGLDFRQCFISEFATQDWAVRHGCK